MSSLLVFDKGLLLDYASIVPWRIGGHYHVTSHLSSRDGRTADSMLVFTLSVPAFD